MSRQHRWGVWWMFAAIYEGSRVGMALSETNTLRLVISAVLAFMFATFAYTRLTTPERP